MAKLDWIFFDLGGVLYTLDFQAVWDGFCEASGRSVEEVKQALYEENRFNGFETGRISGYDFYAAVTQNLGSCMDFDYFSEVWNRIMVRDEEMFDLASRLKQAARILILSNTNELNARSMERDLRGLAELTVYSFDAGLAKPHPGIFAKAIKYSSAGVGRALYVDDRDENIAAAERIGIRSHRFHTREGLEKTLRSFGMEV